MNTDQYSPFVRYRCMVSLMGERWATVTVTDSKGQRHSVDVRACSTYDAAHLFLTHAKANPKGRLPATSIGCRDDVRGEHIRQDSLRWRRAFQRWILKQHRERNGPAGFLFSKRPPLE